MSIYITTPIYYVNDRPHIGHAYTGIICDVIARFNRLMSNDVKFATGTDEHGQKVELSAKRLEIPTQEFTDKMSESFLDLTKLLNLTNDDFIRTTEERHKKSAQYLWKRIENNGHIYKGNYEGWYSVRDEAFYQESELIDGKAPTGASVEWIKEPSYFFKLSTFEEKLLNLYKENPNLIFPVQRYNEVVSFVRSGLKDLSISRTTFNWGVKVPNNKTHIMYVWLDALANYLTAVGFPDVTNADYLDYWQTGKVIHVIGKDILRFHAVYWLAFLMAADLPLPKKILTHGWWTVNGEKISKSLGNTIEPEKLAERFTSEYVRYFLMRGISFGKDGDFGIRKVISCINSDLADNIGNLTHRTLSMVHKNCDSKVPNCRKTAQVLIDTYSLAQQVSDHMINYKFNEAIEWILNISSLGNKYVDKKAPWKLKKINQLEMEYVLYDLLEMIRCIGILLQPFVPISAKKILDELAIEQDKRLIIHIKKDYAISVGTQLPELEVIFTKLN